MVVPLSPGELAAKVDAIQRHQSQKDRPLFPGADAREFWQRALARNQARRAAPRAPGRAGAPCYSGSTDGALGGSWECDG
jgi:glucosamine-6-phosphate deaminase